jgi:hypothetical protein
VTNWVTIADSAHGHTWVASADESSQAGFRLDQRYDSSDLPDTEEATGSIPVPPSKLRGCDAVRSARFPDRVTAVFAATARDDQPSVDWVHGVCLQDRYTARQPQCLLVPLLDALVASWLGRVLNRLLDRLLHRGRLRSEQQFGAERVGV